MSSGYSKRTLPQKLGIKDGFKIAFVNAPPDYAKKLGKLPRSVIIGSATEGDFDLIHFFARSRYLLKSEFPQLMEKISRKGMLWISWPKKASGEKTDLNDNVVRQIGLDCGMVDIKVAAIDETWSGLKFVFRKSSP